jgi:hypothetical protein
MENKTAVQWLIDEINEKHFFLFSKLGEQALKIEKEQIEDAYIMGSYDMADKEFRPEQYYNEIYGK